MIIDHVGSENLLLKIVGSGKSPVSPPPSPIGKSDPNGPRLAEKGLYSI